MALRLSQRLVAIAPAIHGAVSIYDLSGSYLAERPLLPRSLIHSRSLQHLLSVALDPNVVRAFGEQSQGLEDSASLALLSALDGLEDVVLLAGALLVVKHAGVVHLRKLTASEITALNEDRDVLRYPGAVLGRLSFVRLEDIVGSGLDLVDLADQESVATLIAMARHQSAGWPE